MLHTVDLLSIVMLLMMGIGFIIIPSFAQQTSLDLTAPSISELYGGKKRGT